MSMHRRARTHTHTRTRVVVLAAALLNLKLSAGLIILKPLQKGRHGVAFTRTQVKEGQRRRRPSAGLLSKPSRPLEVKKVGRSRIRVCSRGGQQMKSPCMCSQNCTGTAPGPCFVSPAALAALLLQAGLLLRYMLGHMRELYGGQDEADTARKMMHVATMVSGGIELA
eukprot:1158018-Pelagomonas_calceolata.AAC.3